MLNKYDYAYNHEISIIHRINPLIKLWCFVLFFISCFLKYNNIVFFSTIISIFMMLIFSNIKLNKYLKVIWVNKYIFIFIYFLLRFLNVDSFDINVILFKLMFGILFVYLIIYTTSKEKLAKCLASFVDQFNFIRLSKKKLIAFFSNIINFVLLLGKEVNLLFESNSLKGNDLYFLSIIQKIKYLCKSFKLIYNNAKIKNIKRKDSMKYRFFDVALPFEYKYRNKLNVIDFILLGFYIFIFVYYIVKVIR